MRMKKLKEGFPKKMKLETRRQSCAEPVTCGQRSAMEPGCSAPKRVASDAATASVSHERVMSGTDVYHCCGVVIFQSGGARAPCGR
jgi:hypothetical protein